jgi:hypothetical protein
MADYPLARMLRRHRVAPAKSDGLAGKMSAFPHFSGPNSN